MYWQENKETTPVIIPDSIVDAVFSISCRHLPVDHAYSLSQAVLNVLPWLVDEANTGIHPIHVAESGNGWMRPENADDLLHLSKRTKLVLRLPLMRIEDANELVGKTLDIAGNACTINKMTHRLLSDQTTLFSRYVVSETGDDEAAFMDLILEQLHALDIKPTKMLPGREHTIATPDGIILARSLMLAELEIEESIRLQQEGLGSKRHLGCGIFIPHRDIKEVGETSG